MVNPDDFYHGVELTEDEVAMAILEAKRKKWFHMKHADYWESLESKKGKTKLISYESRAQTPQEDSQSSK